ncbi:uncharacterized protein PHACADRAFT_262379 [Phanerochaete carnosa HHB-10118-sp]|uniref:DUF7918 domain-containing protein n=1 Tax=Phanerochaete carnosa (strain HHB-10118-sp) TaxID=650164 RepID=K5VKM8_PHACS|nr:uncharacterized protein PHACADRAFT_262379 [Phanerochaete carnosa HHB-10118-sp]EKM51953.1 hypothetical protein PHACADRAFT_262379 [Phanerochaete carnosa HHB-10118-sp]
MPSNYGISISIVCGGSILEEYAWQSADERTASCFVPSASGKNFEIILTNNLNLQDVSVSITVDGSPIGRYYLAPGQKLLPGIYVSETTTKPFRFRSLVFNDEKGIHDPWSFTWENTGSIGFSIYRCRSTGIEQFRPQDPALVSYTARYGKARAATPAVLTGGEVPIKPIQGVGGITIDPHDKPYAKILVQYRPREILQMQGVIKTAFSCPSTASSTEILQAQGAVKTASSRPSTASSTAVSQPGRKRSLDSMSLLAESSGRPSQRLRGTPLTENSPPRLRSSHSTDSRQSGGSWAVHPAPSLPGGPGTPGELALMKTRLKHATEQMHGAMREMRSSMELMNSSMHQMQFLQQRIEALEARQLPPPPSLSTALMPVHTASQSSPTAADAVWSQQDRPSARTFASFSKDVEHNGREQELLDEGVGELQWP